MNIKELRDKTGQTQKDFAARFGIPIGTLRRWEYGESTPAPYIMRFIADSIPEANAVTELIEYGDEKYFYNKLSNSLIDSNGNKIHINVDISDVKKQNLAIYVKDLFDAYNMAIARFYKDCELDKTEDIIWS